MNNPDFYYKAFDRTNRGAVRAKIGLSLIYKEQEMLNLRKELVEVKINDQLRILTDRGMKIVDEIDSNFKICDACEFDFCHLCPLPDEYREAH